MQIALLETLGLILKNFNASLITFQVCGRTLAPNRRVDASGITPQDVSVLRAFVPAERPQNKIELPCAPLMSGVRIGEEAMIKTGDRGPMVNVCLYECCW